MSRSILTETLERAAHWPIEAQAELAAYAAEIQAGLSVDRIFARYRKA